MSYFIGRQAELDTLKALLSKPVASLVVIRGRRRIGKSRLAEKFAEQFPKSYLFSGIPPEKGVTAKEQRKEFLRQLQQYKIPSFKSDDWGDMLDDLGKFCQNGRTFVLLDEITWMGGKDPTFIPKIKNAWDRFFKKNTQLILVISGSNAAWIQKKILESRGFFGRVSLRVHLDELSLAECNHFFDSWPGIVAPYEKFKVLSVTGGVPRYLEDLNPNLTAEQNIEKLCFHPEGLLFNEFDEMFYDLFQKKAGYYKQLMSLLIDARHSPQKIADLLNVKYNGNITNSLEILRESGFLARDYTWGLSTQRISKISHYRVRDNYVRFYLKYILPNRASITNGSIKRLPSGWYTIMGLQFENLVINQKEKLVQLLNLQNENIVQAGPFIQTKQSRRAGCQIDYMIQTEFRTLYLFEIRFHQQAIGTEVIADVQNKLNALQLPRGFSCRPILIHINGVTNGIIDSGFFAKIIDFNELLNA